MDKETQISKDIFIQSQIAETELTHDSCSIDLWGSGRYRGLVGGNPNDTHSLLATGVVGWHPSASLSGPGCVCDNLDLENLVPE
jgi:hypothetical protein